jgi:hypothetical protein
VLSGALLLLVSGGIIGGLTNFGGLFSAAAPRPAAPQIVAPASSVSYAADRSGSDVISLTFDDNGQPVPVDGSPSAIQPLSSEIKPSLQGR